LDITQRYAGVECGGDEAVPERVWGDRLVDPGVPCEATDETCCLVSVHTVCGIGEEYRAFAAFVAQEFDYLGPVNPVAQVINSEYAKLDQAASTVGSVPIVPTETEALARAEAAGDYDATMEIKSHQIARRIGPG
jgi:hypothetical protein